MPSLSYRFLYFAILFIGISVFSWWVDYMNWEGQLYYSPWLLGGFGFVSCIIIFLILERIAKMAPDKVGMAFMGLSMLQIMAAILMILPMILSDQRSISSELLLLFIPLVGVLVLEVLYALRLLKNDS